MADLCSVTVEQMRQHVMELIEQHGFVYSWCSRPSKAKAVQEFGEIWIAPIRSAISYATALHEIGHILGRHQRSRRTMVRERGAWEWARANALIWTPAMERRACDSLAWYAPLAARLDIARIE